MYRKSPASVKTSGTSRATYAAGIGAQRATYAAGIGAQRAAYRNAIDAPNAEPFHGN